MDAFAVVLDQPESLSLSRLPLTPPGDADVVVDIDYSGISTGTERLLWQGRMPTFPGMGYPLVPGYESVGRIVAAGPKLKKRIGETVFVPGASCFGDVRGLFGGAASRLVVPAARVVSIDPNLGERGVLLALAATAYHVISPTLAAFPELIVGHGVLGRLLARIITQSGATPPVVWETNPVRMDGAEGYTVLHPDGTAAAHACAPGPHPEGPPDPRTLTFNEVIRGPCDHAQAHAGYRPGRKLRHLITARNATCTAPGCGQPAARCDLDHTTPWHHGGPTCPCNLSPLCRHHHRVKQAQGWWLEMPEPGVLRWRTPAGRTHTTTPTVYPL